MKLTENFTLSEMIKSETALRHNLDNTPGDAEIANLKRLAEKILQITIGLLYGCYVFNHLP